MDQLRQGIGLQSLGQRDPVVEYRLQGFDMFEEMITSIREEVRKNAHACTYRAEG